MPKKSISPLQYRDFFDGEWYGEGELKPRALFRWFMPTEKVTLRSRTEWLSDKLWMVRETFEFSSGNKIDRTMFVEAIGADRLHVTADDMPLGADLLLKEEGFFFTEYFTWSQYKGRKWLLKCIDENVVDEAGVIQDSIRMYYHGIYVASMNLRVTIKR